MKSDCIYIFTSEEHHYLSQQPLLAYQATPKNRNFALSTELNKLIFQCTKGQGRQRLLYSLTREAIPNATNGSMSAQQDARPKPM